MCRVYDAFTLEAILSTGFGRQVNIQLGESDEFAKAMIMAVAGFADGQFEGFILLNSKIKFSTISISIADTMVSHLIKGVSSFQG